MHVKKGDSVLVLSGNDRGTIRHVGPAPYPNGVPEAHATRVHGKDPNVALPISEVQVPISHR